MERESWKADPRRYEGRFVPPDKREIVRAWALTHFPDLKSTEIDALTLEAIDARTDRWTSMREFLGGCEGLDVEDIRWLIKNGF